MEEGSIQTSLGTSPKCRLWLDARHPRDAEQTRSPECKSVEKNGCPEMSGRSKWGRKRKKKNALREYIHTRMDVHEDERGNKGKVKKIESPISAPTKNRVDTLSH